MVKKKKMTKSEERAYNRGKQREKVRNDLKKTQRKVKRTWAGIISLVAVFTIYIFFKAVNIKTGSFFSDNVDLLFWGSLILLIALIVGGRISYKKFVSRAKREIQ